MGSTTRISGKIWNWLVHFSHLRLNIRLSGIEGKVL
jgi:hypothetical protein